jgi:hypothetical protein
MGERYDRRWLFAIAGAERVRTQARAPRDGAPPPIFALADLSMYECSTIIDELDGCAKRGERPPSYCLRCNRIGFVQTAGEPCMHSKAGTSASDRRTAEIDRDRGGYA